MGLFVAWMKWASSKNKWIKKWNEMICCKKIIYHTIIYKTPTNKQKLFYPWTSHNIFHFFHISTLTNTDGFVCISSDTHCEIKDDTAGESQMFFKACISIQAYMLIRFCGFFLLDLTVRVKIAFKNWTVEQSFVSLIEINTKLCYFIYENTFCNYGPMIYVLPNMQIW